MLWAESLRKAAEEQEWDEERTIVELYLDAEGIERELFSVCSVAVLGGAGGMLM